MTILEIETIVSLVVVKGQRQWLLDDFHCVEYIGLWGNGNGKGERGGERVVQRETGQNGGEAFGTRG